LTGYPKEAKTKKKPGGAENMGFASDSAMASERTMMVANIKARATGSLCPLKRNRQFPIKQK